MSFYSVADSEIPLFSGVAFPLSGTIGPSVSSCLFLLSQRQTDCCLLHSDICELLVTKRNARLLLLLSIVLLLTKTLWCGIVGLCRHLQIRHWHLHVEWSSCRWGLKASRMCGPSRGDSRLQCRLSCLTRPVIRLGIADWTLCAQSFSPDTPAHQMMKQLYKILSYFRSRAKCQK